jgi:hypothetical protein
MVSESAADTTIKMFAMVWLLSVPDFSGGYVGG